MKYKQIVVTWRDSSIINEQTDISPEVAMIITCGFLIKDNDGNLIIARDLIEDEYRGQIVIPNENVIKRIYLGVK